VDSNPSSSIIWYRDGSGEIVSRTAGFELLRVEREQAGRYFCQANNTLGSSNPQFVDIDVLCKYYKLFLTIAFTIYLYRVPVTV